MSLTPHQKEIISIAQAIGGDFTKAQVVEAIGGNYYCNGDKHVGDRLSRMVKAGLLIRVKKGLFRIGTGTKLKPATIAEGQTILFER